MFEASAAGRSLGWGRAEETLGTGSWWVGEGYDWEVLRGLSRLGWTGGGSGEGISVGEGVHRRESTRMPKLLLQPMGVNRGGYR